MVARASRRAGAGHRANASPSPLALQVLLQHRLPRMRDPAEAALAAAGCTVTISADGAVDVPEERIAELAREVIESRARGGGSVPTAGGAKKGGSKK